MFVRIDRVKELTNWKCFICCASEATGKPSIRDEFLTSLINGTFNYELLEYNISKCKQHNL